jgi:hypothetical protein
VICRPAKDARRECERSLGRVSRKRVWSSEKLLLSLGCHRITMVQPAESRKGLNLAFTRRPNFCSTTSWRVLRQSKMCPVLMVVKQVRRHQPFEMALIQDDHVIQQVASTTSHPALSNTVLPRTAKGSASWLASNLPHSRNHIGAKLCVAVRIARICAALYRPKLLALAVLSKAHWDFASH